MYLERLRIFAVRLFTGMDRNGPNNRNGLPENVYCIRTGWPSIVIVKFGQMNILTHENVTLYGGVITCLLACDSVCSTRRYS